MPDIPEIVPIQQGTVPIHTRPKVIVLLPTIFIGSIFLSLIASLLFVWYPKQQTVTKNSSSPLPSIKPTEQPVNNATYINEEYNFKFTIPEGWTTEIHSPKYIAPHPWLHEKDIVLFELSVLEKTFFLTQGSMRISIQQTSEKSLDEWQANAHVYTPHDNTELIEKREDVEINGMPAIKFTQFAFDGDIVYYVLLNNDTVYILQYWDSSINDDQYTIHQKAYDEIISSFQLLSSTSTPSPTSHGRSCQNAGGVMLEGNNECKGVNQQQCALIGGQFDGCTSACGTPSPGTACIQTCIPRCSFDSSAQQ